MTKLFELLEVSHCPIFRITILVAKTNIIYISAIQQLRTEFIKAARSLFSHLAEANLAT